MANEIDRKLYHEQVADVLREEICRQHQPGDRLEAETRLAERFAVSVITIREAIRLLCHQGLVERRRGSGTYVKRTQKQQRVGMINPVLQQEGVAFSYFQRADALCTRILDEHGIEVIHLFPEDHQVITEADSDWLYRVCHERNLAGLLFFRGYVNKRVIARLEEEGVALLGINANRFSTAVLNDMEGLVSAGTDYLIRHGRRRLAFVQPTRGDWYLQRTFRTALEKSSIPFNPEWICWPESDSEGCDGCSRLQKLLNGPEAPDGLLIGLDTCYNAAAIEVLRLGLRIPEQLLVVTHSNRGSGALYAFPTVRLEMDPALWAQTACKLLQNKLAGRRVRKKVHRLGYQWRGQEEVERRLKNPQTEKTANRQKDRFEAYTG